MRNRLLVILAALSLIVAACSDDPEVTVESGDAETETTEGADSETENAEESDPSDESDEPEESEEPEGEAEEAEGETEEPVEGNSEPEEETVEAPVEDPFADWPDDAPLAIAPFDPETGNPILPSMWPTDPAELASELDLLYPDGAPVGEVTIADDELTGTVEVMSVGENGEPFAVGMIMHIVSYNDGEVTRWGVSHIMAPSIQITSPAPWSTQSGPSITVEGEARAFEGNLEILLEGAAGGDVSEGLVQVGALGDLEPFSIELSTNGETGIMAVTAIDAVPAGSAILTSIPFIVE